MQRSLDIPDWNIFCCKYKTDFANSLGIPKEMLRTPGESIPHNLLWIRRTLSCHRAGIPDNSKPWPDDILLPDSLTRYNLPFCEENSHPLQHFLPMSRTLSCNNLPVPYFLSYAGSGITARVYLSADIIAYGYQNLHRKENTEQANCYMTMYVTLGENAAADGCFPHRTEDYIVLKSLAEEYHLAMAYYYLGCLLYDRRVYDESIEDYEESILRSPGASPSGIPRELAKSLRKFFSWNISNRNMQLRLHQPGHHFIKCSVTPTADNTVISRTLFHHLARRICLCLCGINCHVKSCLHHHVHNIYKMIFNLSFSCMRIKNK